MADSLNTHFLARKLHSLLGLVPVGAFLAFHLWENSMSRKGAAFFNEHVVLGIEETLNYKLLAEAALVGAILAHAIYGLVIWWQGRTNVGRYPYANNVRYLLQRISALIVFAFIIWHFWQTRVQAGLHPEVHADLFSHMQQIYANPLNVVLYLIGITAATFHLAQGLWLAGITWGITTHPRSQLISTVVCAGLFVGLTALGYHALWGFNKAFF